MQYCVASDLLLLLACLQPLALAPLVHCLALGRITMSMHTCWADDFYRSPECQNHIDSISQGLFHSPYLSFPPPPASDGIFHSLMHLPTRRCRRSLPGLALGAETFAARYPRRSPALAFPSPPPRTPLSLTIARRLSPLPRAIATSPLFPPSPPRRLVAPLLPPCHRPPPVL